MRYILLFAFFATTICNVKAQDTTVVRNAAIIMSNALLKNDLGVLADYTHPKILEAVGGKAKMIALVKASIAVIEARGLTFRSFSIGKIGEFYSDGKDLYCVVPQKILMNTKGGYVSSLSSVLGISEDEGKTWKFVSAGNIGRERLEAIFTGLPDGLDISPQTEPVFYEE